MMKQILRMVLFLAAALLIVSCGSKNSLPQGNSSNSATGVQAKVTFLELGSVTCIPCKKMQPIMKSIETRYGGQVNVIFHDVMKDRSKSQEYGIKLIPTQVFLDATGKELMRHEGFFAEEEIDKFLQAQGLTPNS